MKNIGPAGQPTLLRRVVVRNLTGGAMVLFLTVFVLFQNGGRVVKADYSIGNVASGTGPLNIAVNPVTNKVYVVNNSGNNVTVIDGSNNSTATVATGSNPGGVAVNPVTNKIYIANQGGANVTVIDGSNNTTATVGAGSHPIAVAANPVTNKIYVANCGSLCGGTGNGNVTVIDGSNNSSATVTAGTSPFAVAVNPVTNNIYVANRFSNNVSAITPAPTNAIPLNTAVTPLAGNTTSSFIPTFTLTATSTYSPTAPPPRHIYFQVDTANGTWTRATNTGSTATTLTATAQTGVLQNGMHTLYFFASDGTDATSVNPLLEPLPKWKGSIPDSDLIPGSSPLLGGINAYVFRVLAGPTAAGVSVSGRVLATDGAGVRNAVVTMTDLNGVTRTARSSAFGYYRFDEVEAGQTVTIAVASKRFTFTPRVVTVADQISDLDFVSIDE